MWQDSNHIILFYRLFWEQQEKAASQRNSKSMKSKSHRSKNDFHLQVHVSVFQSTIAS